MLVLLGFGAWQFLKHYRIDGVGGIKIIPRTASARPAEEADAVPPRGADTIKIATFNIQVFGTSKIQKPHVVEILARIARQFDVLAIQEVRSRDQDILPRFVEAVNAAGRHYDYVIGPRLPLDGAGGNPEQYAFVFDKEVLEVDRARLYTIDDPDDLLAREPLVAWFRSRSVPSENAFTFTLVNVHTDPDQARYEVDQLAQVYSVVVNDGRNEDDVIVLGDFNTDDRHYGRLGQVPGLDWAVSGVPTNTRGTESYDNILFHRQATAEFTGRSGVVDYLREYNLTIDQALEVSDHLPVWAEFSAREGGRSAIVAGAPRPAAR
ncbi:MAG: endonuclease/exonuclease/phosphatase [Planctomycetes bacterium]|nr:endonuclease/exonuclease/phosphatase [Planctomycetota bacterium]